MDREAAETPEGRKIVIILSDRSREIIRLFEELWRKRQQLGHGSLETALGEQPRMQSGVRDRWSDDRT